MVSLCDRGFLGLSYNILVSARLFDNLAITKITEIHLSAYMNLFRQLIMMRNLHETVYK